MTEPLVSYGRRISELADRHPDRPVIIFATEDGQERTLTWGDLDRQSNQVARLLQEEEVGLGSMVLTGLPNCPELIVIAVAAWKVGACILTARAALPERERNGVIEAASPSVVIADWENVPARHLRPGDLVRAASLPDSSLPDCIPPRANAKPSGGSTGRPKIILMPGPGVYTPNSHVVQLYGMRPGQTQLAGGALYHAAPWAGLVHGILNGHKVILMDRFDAARFVDLAERHRAQHAFLAPIMMQRIARLPDIDQRDLSSFESVVHAGAVCPAWVKRRWIELIGPEKLYEYYAMTESLGSTSIRGDEWLKRPGTVGKPVSCDIEIRDPDGRPLPPGEIGEIWLRSHFQEKYQYLNAEPLRSTPDGFVTAGDLGWMDEDGYLYISDRRVDMIVTGGANVFPAEVEAVLSEHPQVADVVVIGLPDPEWGRRVHAIVQPRDYARLPAVEELDALCRQGLAAYKVPKSYEFVQELPRMATGKINRRALLEERLKNEPADGAAGR